MLAAMGVGLGDHFIADDIEHGAAGKGQGKGQNGGSEADGKVTQQTSNHLHQAGGHGTQEGLAGSDTGGQHGANDDHALRDVLQGDAAGDHQSLRGVLGAEADAGRDAFGQIVDGDGGDEEQNLAQIGIVVGFDVRADHFVQMRHQLVNEIQTGRTGKDAGNRNEQAPIAAVFQRRKNQTQDSGGQHDTCRKGQDDVRKLMGDIFEYKTQDGAEYGSAAYAQGGEKNHFHDGISFRLISPVYAPPEEKSIGSRWQKTPRPNGPGWRCYWR